MADENIREPIETGAETNTDETPSVEELMKINAELVRKNAEYEVQNRKLNQLKDKNLSQIGTLEKELKKRMTDAEQAEVERLEAKQRMEEHVAELERYKAVNEAVARYALLGMDREMAKQAADAEISGNMDLLAEIQRQHTQQTVKKAQAEWLKSRPQANVGSAGGTTVTQEQFDKMNMIQRTQLLKESPDVYRALLNNSK